MRENYHIFIKIDDLSFTIALADVKITTGLLATLIIVALAVVVVHSSDAEGEIGDSFSEGILNYEVILETPATVRVTGINDPSASELVIPLTVSHNSKSYAVTEISKDAFKSNTALTSVTISENIVTIGTSAFEGCKNVSIINFNAISCGDLTSGSSLKGLGTNVGLSVIFGPGVTKVPAYLFQNSTAVRDVVIESGIKVIGDRAFQANTKLTSVDMSHATSLNSIGIGAFGGCKALIEADFSQSPVTTVGDSAFTECSNLTSITLNEGITYLGASAFSKCSRVSSIYYDIPKLDEWKAGRFSEVGRSADSTGVIFGPHVKEIPNNIFSNGATTNNIQSITFGDNIEAIGDYAFTECTKVTSISLPDSLITIGERAFSKCKGLSELVIPVNVKEIGFNAFIDCSGLTTIYYNAKDSTAHYPFITESGPNRTLIFGDTVEKIPSDAFSSWRNKITTYSIPASVKTISEEAFKGSYNIKTISILGTPSLGSKCLALSAVSGLSIQKANCTIYSMFDGDYYSAYKDDNTELNCIVLPHVELELNGEAVNPVPDGWGQYGDKLLRYYENGQTINLPVLSAKAADVAFDGWAPSTGGTMGTSTVSFAANWSKTEPKPIYHTVTFETNGGTPCAPIQVLENDIIPLPTTTRTNYAFAGWSIPEGTRMGNKDITVSASWNSSASSNAVKITFYDLNNNVVERKMGYAGNEVLTAAPVLKDTSTKRFIGWNNYTGVFPEKDTAYYPMYSSSGGSSSNPSVGPTTGSYTVKVVSQTITISGKKTYDSGSTVSGGGVYQYGSKVTIRATPVSGYKFVEWNDGNTQATRTITVLGDVTYTASFTMIDPYEQGYEIGKGIGKMAIAGIIGAIVIAIIAVAVIRHR